jgi:hypothetical protein
MTERLPELLSSVIHGDPKGAAKAAMGTVTSILTPFFGPDMVADAVGRGFMDYWHDQGKFSNPTDTDIQRLFDTTSQVLNTLAPGVVSQIGLPGEAAAVMRPVEAVTGLSLEPGVKRMIQGRLMKAMTGQVDFGGKGYNALDEMLSIATGHKAESVNVKQSYQYNIKRSYRALSDTHQEIDRLLNSQGTVTPREITTAYERMETARYNAFMEMNADAKAMRAFGYMDRDIEKLLDSNGLSKKMAHDIVIGNYKPRAMKDEKRAKLNAALRQMGLPTVR